MSKTVLVAISATIAFVQAGVVNLPIDDVTKSFAAFAVGIVATFVAALVQPPTS